MSDHRPHVVVLTGGIASGKTAVSNRFAALGVPIIDTDLIARDVVEPGQAGLTAIVQRFGEDMLLDDGTLNRRRLRSLVFSNAQARQSLESLLHPLILTHVRRAIAAIDDPYCVVVIPLFAETGAGADWADTVVVVDVNESEQLRRLEARDGVSPNQARAALGAQVDRATRLAMADLVLPNEGGLEDLDFQVRELHKRILRRIEPDLDPSTISQ